VTDVYQGGDGNRSELGQGADVVLQLTETLPTDKCYKVFADNFFTSVPLIEKLQERGMHYVGTVRPNRLPGCVLQNESELKKRGRGSFVHKVEQTRNIVAVRWFDNRSVNLLSTYVGVEPIQQSRRWDKKTKQYIYIDRPEIVHEYNHFMGGIDLLDSLLAKYRYKMKSRRWYLYLFWHTLVIGLVNAWLVYRRDCSLLSMQKREILNRRRFQAQVADALILVSVSRKRGRPSLEDSTVLAEKKVCREIRNGPCDDVRKDCFAHWPAKTDKRGRCKVCVKNQTNTLCEKCNVRLCFTDERNYFRFFSCRLDIVRVHWIHVRSLFAFCFLQSVIYRTFYAVLYQYYEYELLVNIWLFCLLQRYVSFTVPSVMFHEVRALYRNIAM